MPVKEALSGLEKGLDCLNADLATFKEKLGDLLGMMVPSDGKEGEVDQESDAVNEVSTKLDATIEQLVKDAKDLRVQIEMLEETPSTLKASDGPARRPSKEEGLTQDEVYAEVDNLRSNLSEVTIREKERVEGLSVQLEMARQELADTRNQRRLEQASLAAAESQSSQLRAALTCAEDDIKSLRLTLDNELVRSQRLQSQLTELGDELRASRRSSRPSSAGPGRVFSAGRGQDAPHDGRRDLEDMRFGEFMADRRTEVEARGASGRIDGFRGASRLHGGGGVEVQQIRPLSGPLEGEVGEEGVFLGDPVAAGMVGDERREPRNRVMGQEGLMPRRDEKPFGIGRVRVRPTSAPLVKAGPPGGNVRLSNTRSRRPAAASGRTTPIDSSMGVSALSSIPAVDSRIGRGSDSHASARNTSGKELVDKGDLQYLREHVEAGHVTKTTALQLSLEYCGKSSFSVRHNEAKYALLAEQTAVEAYNHFKDRWMTVLKNAEPDERGESIKQPRLGSFEVDLLWVDSIGKPVRTRLHSKLASRKFPNPAAVMEALAAVLNQVEQTSDFDAPPTNA